MPGYIIHLTEANMVLQQMPDWYRVLCSESGASGIHKDEYLCGSVLPDSVPRPQKKHTHFWADADMDKVLITPCLQEFLAQHGGNLTDPLVLGYFAHLHLDYVFFRDYFPRYIRFVNAAGDDTLTEQSIHHIEIVEQQRQISVRQLFSDGYLYGDYTKLNAQLIQIYGLPDLASPSRTDNPFGMDIVKSLTVATEELNQYLIESRTVSGEPQILKLPSLESFIQQAAIDFWQLVEQNIRRE